MCIRDRNGAGLQFSNLFEEQYNFRVGTAFVSYIFNIFFQLLLGLYLDNVLPKQYGKRQHPCFMFQKSYWFGEKLETEGSLERLLQDGEDPELDGAHRDFEKVPPATRQMEKSGD